MEIESLHQGRSSFRHKCLVNLIGVGDTGCVEERVRDYAIQTLIILPTSAAEFRGTLVHVLTASAVMMNTICALLTRHTNSQTRTFGISHAPSSPTT
jgi:hypothetical protein